MWNLLITIRDLLLALALAWVGVTLEPKASAPEQTACSAGEAGQCAPNSGN